MKKFTPNQLILAQLAFLTETAQHYTSENRGVKKNNSKICCYVRGCAIGRHCPLKLRETLDGFASTVVSNRHIFDLLPPKLKRLGNSFLLQVQKLHDDSVNWNQDGLSIDGLASFQVITKDVLNGVFTY